MSFTVLGYKSIEIQLVSETNSTNRFTGVSKFVLPVEKATYTPSFLKPMISSLPSPSTSAQALGLTSLENRIFKN